MQIKIFKEAFETLGESAMQRLVNISAKEYGWDTKIVTFDPRRHPWERIEEFRKLVEQHKPRGWSVILRDIRIFERSKQSVKGVRLANCSQFCDNATLLLQDTVGHRIYMSDSAANAYRAYYVTSIKFYPKRRTRDGDVIPEYTQISYCWMQLGKKVISSRSFYRAHVIGKTASAALTAAGIYPETPELRAEYLRDTERYFKLVDKIGLQCIATGEGRTQLSDRWGDHRLNNIAMERDGEASRVVIDVFDESDKVEETNSDDKTPDAEFWESYAIVDEHTLDDDADEEETAETGDEEPDEVEETAASKKLEIPVYPLTMTFDLKRQIHVSLHIAQLTVYDYDKTLGEKLVLPGDHKALIETLLEHGGAFEDIVKGKGGGAIVMCTGLPGTGKTLSAEVFAEASERPLYSVQASQLGVNPSDLEGNLMRTFVRAQRWNAILLVDEADVYVRERGNDLEQNAIVGVFLRVLEYYKGVMFLTSNRLDLIDDAILSRCIAKVHFGVPPIEDQRRIWKILSKIILGAELSDEMIAEITAEHNHLSGRDIKSMLKLIKLTKKEPSAKVVSFVAQFRPSTTDPYRHDA